MKIKRVATLLLPITRKYILKVFAGAAYEPPIKKLIHRKFSGDILASKQLAKIIAKNTDLANMIIDYIVPIPLHWSRFAWRGFNQALVVSKELGKILDVSVLDILKRTRRTTYQSLLPIEQRAENVRNVFTFKKSYAFNSKEMLYGKTVLLVDDLLTTGATLKNAAKVLVRCEPKAVIAVVAARIC